MCYKCGGYKKHDSKKQQKGKAAGSWQKGDACRDGEILPMWVYKMKIVRSFYILTLKTFKKKTYPLNNFMKKIMNKIMKLIKDYQTLIVALAPVIIGATIKPIREWFIKALNYNVTIKVWGILVIIVLLSGIGWLLYYTRKKLMNKCKFPTGKEVAYIGNTRRMIVLKYNPFKDELLCSWIEGKEQKRDWFNQSTLEEYKDIDYNLNWIRSTRDNRHSY